MNYRNISHIAKPSMKRVKNAINFFSQHLVGQTRQTLKRNITCKHCGHPTKMIGTMWFDEYLPIYARLIARISQIGPHHLPSNGSTSSSGTFICPSEYFKENSDVKPSFFEYDFIQIMRILLARHAVEIDILR